MAVIVVILFMCAILMGALFGLVIGLKLRLDRYDKKIKELSKAISVNEDYLTAIDERTIDIYEYVRRKN
jgi:uncharacterized membrane protein YqgA involved in biofilm formation